jgi:hypothetical protein
MAHGVYPLTNDMVAVPLSFWQRVEQLLEKQEVLEHRLNLLESVSISNSEYLNRQQAMQFLQIGSTKLWELKNSGLIETSSGTGKTLYKTSSCRDFLLYQGFSQEKVQQSFREILQSRKK